VAAVQHALGAGSEVEPQLERALEIREQAFGPDHPEIADAQIAKLLGTTKTTIQSVRDRSHWNSTNLQPQDPVGLGLCTQIDLDTIVRKAAAKRAKLGQPQRRPSPFSYS